MTTADERSEKSASQPESRKEPNAPARPGTPAPQPPLPPLPGAGEEPRAVLMMVDPDLLHLYWVLDQSLHARAESGAPAVLVTEAGVDGVHFSEVARAGFDFRAPSWYLENAHTNCTLRLRLGLEGSEGFEELLRTNALRIPRTEPGDQPERWLDLTDKRKERAALAPIPHVRVREADFPLAVSRAGNFEASSHVLPASPGKWNPSGKPIAGGATLDIPAPPADAFLALVLHAHLPFVRHPHRTAMEESWLFEAILGTYLPLLDVLDHLEEEGAPGRITMSLTPPLGNMLRDPVLMDKFDQHLARMCELAALEVDRTRHDPHYGPVAGFYRDRLERQRYLFDDAYGRDLVGHFARLQEQGRIELITCTATHGFLPLLHDSPEAVRAQVRVGIEAHTRLVGRAPRGMWLGECAYFEGLDEILAQEGIDYFFVETHSFEHASSKPRYGVQAPLYTPAGVAAFARDAKSSQEVWSAEQGYPGDPSYRDFYRDIGFDLDHVYVAPFLDPSGIRSMTGFKYHAITGKSDHKNPYDRAAALRTVARHAGDFVHKRWNQARALEAHMDRKPLIVAMFDAELFGHWWFEGPEWIENILRKLPMAGVLPVGASQYLDTYPINQQAEPSSSSWGANGYNEVWLNGTNDWEYPPLHWAGRKMARLAGKYAQTNGLVGRALRQAGRELLLAQSSDWPFILKNQTTVGYATRRIHDHLHDFARLAEQIESGRIDEAFLASLEQSDNIFPELDPTSWSAT